MDKITIEPHVFDQMRILFYGVPCGYCKSTPGGPVNFFAGRMDMLTLEEKADVIQHVQETIGAVKRTAQTRKVFDVIDARTNSGRE